MVQKHRTHSFQSRQYEVEVLSTDDPWARFGQPFPERSSPVPERIARINWRRISLYLSGLTFTALLHGVLLGTLLLGTQGRPKAKAMPLSEGASASANDESMEMVSMLVLLNEHSITPPGQQDDSVYAMQKLAEQAARDAILLSSVSQPSPPILSGSDEGADSNSPTMEATGDSSGRAMLFGRYLGQVKARIERAWEIPVTALSDTFECKVQIRQTPSGEVKEVTLQRCGDDLAWQLSLVQAIQQASPLSAPPDESVFTEIVTLSFEARTVDTVAAISAEGGFYINDLPPEDSSRDLDSVEN